jgi:hypothetical protein
MENAKLDFSNNLYKIISYTEQTKMVASNAGENGELQ